MRIPLTCYAKREIILFGGLGSALTILAFVLSFFFPQFVPWWVGLAPLVITGWVFSFFRDPERPIPQGEKLLLSPADGRITAIETIETPAELISAGASGAAGAGGAAGANVGGKSLRISIFLSVFNCHLNRAPCAAQVAAVIYKEGQYLNALNAESSKMNEQNIVILRPEAAGQPILVRQVSGAIARRIVCRAKSGDRLAAGQRFGMIKFGSRTDLIVPAATPVELLVKVGDRVKAGLTILGRYQ